MAATSSTLFASAKFPTGVNLDERIPDEHSNFVRQRRDFTRVLLSQFRPEETSGFSMEASSAEDPFDTGNAPGTSSVSNAYIARFAHPLPAHPIWAAAPKPSFGQEESGQQPHCHGCAPLVCVVFKDTEGYEKNKALHQALCNLATHSIKLMVTIKPEVAVDEKGQRLFFALVGLQASSPGLKRTAVFGDDTLTKAEQRQLVWGAVHEALEESGGSLAEVVEEVFMVQDVWLYNRLYRWLKKKGNGLDGHGPLGLLFQEELDLLVDEYGEETASYFLFINFYTRHLRGAAIVALLCIIITLLDKQGYLGAERTVENWKRSLLVVFLPSWGFYFLASWRSVASKAGFRWHGSLGSVQNSVKEVARLQAMESNSQRRWRYMRVLGLSVPLMLLQMCVVFMVTVGFVCVEVYIYDVIWEVLQIYGRVVAFTLYNLAFGVAFVLILWLFHPISKMVTSWERHPDKEVEMWHLTTKIFANWFFAVFMYFFVIAFCYIPFGDSIAEFIALLFPDTSGEGRGHFTVRGALEGFRPEIHRLAVDVSLFFVLQDAVRLTQVLVPVGRAVYNVKQLSIRRGSAIRNKRSEIFVRACREAWASCWCNSRCCRTRKPASADASPVKVQVPDSDNDGMKASLVQNSETSFSRLTLKEEVRILYIFMENITVERGEQQNDFRSSEQVCTIAARLDAKTAKNSSPSLQSKLQDELTTVRSRLHVCLPPGLRGKQQDEKEGGPLREEKSVPGDLITLTCDPELFGSEGEDPTIGFNIRAELLTAPEGPVAEASPGVFEQIRIAPAEVLRKTVQDGSVKISFIAGLVTGPTHHEALEQVPRALRLAREGKLIEASSSDLPSTPSHQLASAEAEAMENGMLPWLWWDEELACLYWDEVFELFAVKESFETFELYGHLTTQFSYVCLFSIAVPVCPLLAFVCTAVEVRQDQLRLLWLSRPPHPDESGKFKRSVTLGAWYTIIRFTCHMSVVVNLLLWGLTYSGLGSTEPAEWSESEWWRAIALFCLCQQASFMLGGVLHRNISQLDQETASAYLRRYTRLQDAMTLQRDMDSSPSPITGKGLALRDPSMDSALRFVRTPSKGVSSLV